MTHLRGIPVYTPNRDDPPNVARWAMSTLCERTVAAVGPITTNAWEVTCPACRRIMRLPELPNDQAESERRHP